MQHGLQLSALSVPTRPRFVLIEEPETHLSNGGLRRPGAPDITVLWLRAFFIPHVAGAGPSDLWDAPAVLESPVLRREREEAGMSRFKKLWVLIAPMAVTLTMTAPIIGTAPASAAPATAGPP